MPASVFSRSTECHNQDKVSMGTIAARDCIRVLELSEQVGAACLLAVVQAVNLRLRDNDLQEVGVLPVRNILDQTSEYFEFLVEDRPLDKDLRKTVDLIRSNYWDLAYEH